MKLNPLSDWVMVHPVEPQGSDSAIIVPEAHKPMRINGIVIEVGPGRITKKGHRVPMEVKVGQVVCFGKNPTEAHTIKIFGQDYYLIPERALLAVISA